MVHDTCISFEVCNTAVGILKNVRHSLYGDSRRFCKGASAGTPASDGRDGNRSGAVNVVVCLSKGFCRVTEFFQRSLEVFGCADVLCADDLLHGVILSPGLLPGREGLSCSVAQEVVLSDYHCVCAVAFVVGRSENLCVDEAVELAGDVLDLPFLFGVPFGCDDEVFHVRISFLDLIPLYYSTKRLSRVFCTFVQIFCVQGVPFIGQVIDFEMRERQRVA